MSPGIVERNQPKSRLLLSNSNRILLLASKTGYQTRVFADGAKRLGYDLVLATDRCHMLDDPWGDQAYAVRFEEPDWAAASIAQDFPDLTGVIAVGDRPTPIVARVAELLKIPYHPVSAVETCRSKHELRVVFREAGLPVPAFHVHSLDETPRRAPWYPCVLKPLGLSASRGVIRANDDAEFVAAFARIRAILESPEIRERRDARDAFIQVEQFIAGREYALEGVVEQGYLHVFAIFEKPDPLDGPFFEETIYVQPATITAEEQRAIESATRTAVQAIGLRRGPMHAEMRVNHAGVWMLELAPRPIGGLCARSLRFEDGSSLEDVVLRHAAGFEVRGLPLERGASGVMMIPIPASGLYLGVSGVEEASNTPGIEDVVITAKERQQFLRLPEGNSYLGFLFARGTTGPEIVRSLKDAHGKLTFDFARELRVV